MDGHKKIECRICLKTMRSDHLRRHMQKHEKKPPQKEVTPPQKEVTEKIEYQSTLDEAALENKLVNKENELMRKLELGRVIEKIMIKRKLMKAGLSAEDRELELFVKHGHDKDVKPVEWRPWQYELLEFINNPTERRIIWVAGGKGSEGKNFFQNQIRGQYGRHRVCKLSLEGKSSDLLHHMREVVDFPTDIFLFNIEMGVYRGDIDYTLLEKIKDGEALAKKYVTSIVRFTTPNVIIVFSNDYPDMGKKITPDRWLIFKINSKMQLEDVTEAKLNGKRGGGDKNKN